MTDNTSDFKEYYQDIDINKLVGIKKLKDFSYPCIEIVGSDFAKTITYHISKESEITYKFTKLDSIWKSQYEHKGDTSMIYTYEYILPKKIIAFNYSNKETFQLADIEIITDNEEIIFYPTNMLIIDPKIENLDSLNSYSWSKFTNQYTVVDSVLINENMKISKDGEIIFENKSCYRYQNFSMMWLLHFARYLQTIKC